MNGNDTTGNVSEKIGDNRLGYCGDLVRRGDYDRFLTALPAEPDAREKLFTLYAFNLEVAKTSTTVSEPVLGQIRYEWWREALEEAAKGERVRHHPVVQALSGILSANSEATDELHRLITGRERDIDADAAFTGMDDFESYAEATSGSLLAAACHILGVADPAIISSARKVGTAWAMTGMMRAAPHNLRRRQMLLPLPVFEANGADLTSLIELAPDEAAITTFREITLRSRALLEEARRGAGKVGHRIFPVFLHAKIAECYIKQLKKMDYNPFNEKMAKRPLSLVPSIWIANLTGRF